VNRNLADNIELIIKAALDKQSMRNMEDDVKKVASKIEKQSPVKIKADLKVFINEQDIKNYQTKMDNMMTNLKTKYGTVLDNPKFKSDLDNLNKQLSSMSIGKTMKSDLTSTNSQFQTLSTNVKKTAKEVKDAKGAFSDFYDDMDKNTSKMLSWSILGGVIYGVFNQIKDGITYVRDMDSALTDLSKVVDLSSSQLNMMKDTAINLGKELGKSSIDIMNSMAEFGRVTKDTAEIIELTKSAAITSNVTSLSAADAAKALNTTMIAFGMGAKDSMKILDSWNEIQNNFRKLCGIKILSN